MELAEICERIELQPELRKPVLDFAKNYDFTDAEIISATYSDFSKISDTTNWLKAILEKDDGNIKILACCLNQACRLYETYKEHGISDEIFFDTMKCFTRFSSEYFEKTGVLAFDRAWWTGRQLGFHLFRVGELEYEFINQNDSRYISVHIPSDAVLTYENTKTSFKEALEFTKKHFPEFVNCEIRCTTWLFSPEIRACLDETSRIRIFGDFFHLTDTGYKNNDFIKWLFKTNNTENYENLKENTSLQRKMKKFLLEGGFLSITSGILRKEFYQ